MCEKSVTWPPLSRIRRSDAGEPSVDDATEARLESRGATPAPGSDDDDDDDDDEEEEEEEEDSPGSGGLIAVHSDMNWTGTSFRTGVVNIPPA